MSLINDLLDISRMESGKMELKPVTLDMRRALLDATNSMQPQLGEKNQLLSLNAEPGLPHVWADPDRVTVILTNLLSKCAQVYAGRRRNRGERVSRGADGSRGRT